MSKRSIVGLAGIVGVAIVLPFHIKEHRSALPVRTAAAASVSVSFLVADASPSPQNRFSQEEYDRLRQRYESNTAQADGPLSKGRLDILARNTKTNTRDQNMWPAFKDVIYGNTVALEKRLDTGLSPDATIFLDYPYNSRFSLLDVAIDAGQRDIIRELLRHDANVNPLRQFAADGTPLGVEPPLPVAAGDGEDDVVRLLLQSGANIEQRRGLPANDQTPLEAAVYSGNISTVYLLLVSGADIRSTLGPGNSVPKVLLQPYIDLDPRVVALRNLLIQYGAKMPPGQ